ncbi:hypothetical protein LCGC14_2914970, partial [marine sediment metagenome]
MPRGVAADFQVRLAQTDADVQAAQRLRYEVFVQELGGSGAMVDHAAGLEQDRFDPFFDHLLLTDLRNGKLAGVYRVMRADMAARAGGFYSEAEYDLTPLVQSGRKLLELGRSCLDPAYRGGAAMHHLWGALARYVAEHEIEVLFGVASFHGTDTAPLAERLARAGLGVLVSTATDESLSVGCDPNIRRRSGRLDRAGLSALIRDESIRALVDATHPYATEIRDNARAAAA